MDRILIIGAGGQIGGELTIALRQVYGNQNVVATDIKDEPELLRTQSEGPFFHLDATDSKAVATLIQKEKITQVYLLAAILSAVGETKPLWAWNINMTCLLDLLETCKNFGVKKFYWPSSIAAFGPNTPKQDTQRHTIMEPTTVYGISKFAGELWCQYYFQKYGLDVRSIRYPGLISWKSLPGGGTTDYAIDIFHKALQEGQYTCFLSENTYLPMMYMNDAIRGTIELMEAAAEKIQNRMAYNLSAMSFSPKELAAEIKLHIPGFNIDYQPDFRQQIADSWPQSINDEDARKDWGWQPEFDLKAMTGDMISNLK